MKLIYIPVEGDSASTILALMAQLFIHNPYNRSLYHSALEVQVPEGDECVRYAIEMQDYVDDVREQQRVGQVKGGYFDSVLVSAFAGMVYGIRKWRNGTIQDVEKAHPNPQVLTEDCAKAREVLGLVSRVPSHRYNTDWTSNSVISWILERAGLRPDRVAPPVNGIRPGWEEGRAAAQS